MEDVFVTLRSVLSQEPSSDVWQELMVRLAACSASHELEAAVEYADAHLTHWPEALRMYTHPLHRALCARFGGFPTDVSHPCWRLVRCASLHHTLMTPVAADTFRDLTHLLLYGEESAPGALPEDFWPLLQRLPSLEALEVSHFSPILSDSLGSLAKMPKLSHFGASSCDFAFGEFIFPARPAAASCGQQLSSLELRACRLTRLELFAADALSSLVIEGCEYLGAVEGFPQVAHYKGPALIDFPCTLRFLGGSREGDEVCLNTLLLHDGQSLTLGRHPAVDIHAREPTWGRNHVRISRRGQMLIFRFLGSGGGACHNERRVGMSDEIVLCAGDRIQIGAVPLLLECDHSQRFEIPEELVPYFFA